jgi:hypothetical protein
MLGAAVRCADVDEAAVDAAVGADVPAPSLITYGQLREPASEDAVLCEAGELGIELGDGFQQFVADLRLSGLLGALLRHPAAGLQQRTDLCPRVQVGAGELLRQLRA